MSKEEGANKVDMLAEAKEAQWSAATFMGSDTVKVIAPAKVNLFLGIGNKLKNGYHEVSTVMHSLALHDVLYLMCNDATERSSEASESSNVAYAGPGGCIEVKIEIIDKTPVSGAGFSNCATGHQIDIPVKENLVFTAIDRLAHELGVSKSQEVLVRIEKHIPLQAGLGGGSSDAAAALVAMSGFWGNSESGPTIGKVASSLGADVSFFLEGGCAFFTGIGEKFERGLDPMKHAAIIIRPDSGISTHEAYSEFDMSPIEVPKELLALAEDANCADDVPLFNNLQPIASRMIPEIAEIVKWLENKHGIISSEGQKLGKQSSGVLMSGSGSAVFAIVEFYSDASRIAADAAACGWWSRATSFCSLKASII